MKKLINLCVMLVFVMLGMVQPVPAHGGVFGGLKGEIQEECDNNPYLKKAGVVVKVEDVTNGYVTIGVVSGVSQSFMAALADGKSLGGISFFMDDRASDLRMLEDVLKKRSDVKDVVWTLAKEGKQKLQEAEAARKNAEAEKRAFTGNSGDTIPNY